MLSVGESVGDCRKGLDGVSSGVPAVKGVSTARGWLGVLPASIPACHALASVAGLAAAAAACDAIQSRFQYGFNRVR